MKHRKTHEILTRTGAPVDPSVRRGQFTRAYNPQQTWLNSYDGPTRPIKMDSQWDPETSPLSCPCPTPWPEPSAWTGMTTSHGHLGP